MEFEIQKRPLSISEWFKSLQDDICNDLVLVLVGVQGIGKTRFFNRLMIDELKDYLITELPMVRSKDAQISLVENILFVIDEIDALNMKESTALKELITKQKIKVRKPYAEKAENFVRRATFAGTTNRKAFLPDMTGSRRFLPFEVKDVNMESDLPVKEAFAQARNLIQSGFQYWLNKEEIKEQEQANEEFQFVEAEEELALSYLRKPREDDPGHIVKKKSTTMILHDIYTLMGLGKALNNTSVKRLGMALTKLGYEKVKHKGSYVWKVVFLCDEYQSDMIKPSSIE